MGKFLFSTFYKITNDSNSLKCEKIYLFSTKLYNKCLQIECSGFLSFMTKIH